ncbi:hypothetical protein ACILDT_11310 [Capnocytophaga canis]|uniref:hypothetical protein n=1 Tax=Capnocytophaga canis TaxID=1848903 RepID=UPI0037D7E6CA
MKKRVLTLFCLLVSIGAFAQQKKTTKKAIKSYTTEDAIKYVEDYFEFYQADTHYENPEARKISNNVFHVKVEVCNAHCYTEKEYTDPLGNTYTRVEKNTFFWHTKVYVLTIKPQGKYTIEEKMNY